MYLFSIVRLWTLHSVGGNRGSVHHEKINLINLHEKNFLYVSIYVNIRYSMVLLHFI